MSNYNFDDYPEANRNSLKQKSVKSTSRFYALDSLRAGAMILGVLAHAVLSNTVNRFPYWPVQDPNQHSIFDFILCAIHIFRLELFFLIAGFFANFIFQNKTLLQFIKNRIVRIGIPFIATWFLMIVCWLIIPFKQKFPDVVMKEIPIYHLWFLYYLLFFYLAFIVLNIALKLSNKIWKFLDTLFYQLLQSPFYCLILMSMTASIMFYMEKAYVDSPLGFKPLYRLLFHYGIFFGYGVFLNRQAQLLETIAKQRLIYLCIAIPSTLLLFVQFFNVPLYPNAVDLSIILLRINYGVVTWSLVLSFIGYFQHYFNQYHPAIRYLADASYWIYLAHLPVVMWFQNLMLDTAFPGYLRPFAAFAGTLMVLILSYHLLVRFTWIGNVLNGPRLRPMLPILRY